jgi:hypothetical protein
MAEEVNVGNTNHQMSVTAYGGILFAIVIVGLIIDMVLGGFYIVTPILSIAYAIYNYFSKHGNVPIN